MYLDYLMHHAANLAIGFAPRLWPGDPHVRTSDGPRRASRSRPDGRFLGLHNDCRYKAFFQRLKRETRSFRVDGGSGGRPAPAPPRPSRGIGRWTWPAYKACEPHVVLLSLTAATPLAWLAPGAWSWSWMLGVAGMAILAPTLAVGRTARAVRRGSVAEEFDRWFRDQGSNTEAQPRSPARLG